MASREKPEIVALNKIDAIPKAALAKKRAALEKASGHKVHLISGVTRRRRRRRAAGDGAAKSRKRRKPPAQARRGSRSASWAP